MEKTISVEKLEKNKIGFQPNNNFDDFEEFEENKVGEFNEMDIDDELMSKDKDFLPLSMNPDVIKNFNDVNKKLNQISTQNVVSKEYRKIMVPLNKLKTLKDNWTTIVKAIVEHMKLDVRMNVKGKCIELRTNDKTTNTSSMQKSEDFLKAFLCGFDLGDAIALLRLEDLFFETFDIKDVKNLKGDHLSRCIGRICGEKGKTKNAIENSTRTRMIVEGHKISLLGAHVNVGMARNAICNLILGAQPGKVFSQLRVMGKKLKELC